jgi:uncharacterized membrane protein/glutaredoxin
MVEVTLYSRADCHLCEQVQEYLEELNTEIPHKLSVIDVDSRSDLQKQYGFNVPVVKVGPYTLRAPIERSDLVITLKAAQNREKHISDIASAITTGTMSLPVNWTRSDGFIRWLSRHYLALFNAFIAAYVFLPFFAPILMRVGATTPAGWIYRAYSVVCHELAFRSWFLFGEQSSYPRASAGVDGLIPYGVATGLDENDLWAARDFRGDAVIGYKVALCERDIAIYGGILLFGIGFAVAGRKIKPVHWMLWILLGLVPIGLDGLSQLVSQPPMNLIPFRESTPIFRSITGFLFGFMTAWFGYPYVEETMRENRKILDDKYQRSQRPMNVQTLDVSGNVATHPDIDSRA